MLTFSPVSEALILTFANHTFVRSKKDQSNQASKQRRGRQVQPTSKKQHHILSDSFFPERGRTSASMNRDQSNHTSRKETHNQSTTNQIQAQHKDEEPPAAVEVQRPTANPNVCSCRWTTYTKKNGAKGRRLKTPCYKSACKYKSAYPVFNHKPAS